ncbi:MAG: hypothetical protein IJ884_02215 [Bacteroidales bacterium]|nr:hypothetical protein [Bacteroidales bacterium]
MRTSFAFCDALDGGILNHFHPGTTRSFAEALKASPVPVISHETGQFQSYPDYAEIDKYEGTPFVPYNLMTFRRRLEQAGMADQAADFHRASGKWVSALYKADMEMCLRTPGMGGYQLLDLQDYPGQGSAYVGILDAFMDDKGFIDRNEWLGFCSDLVPLAEFEKYCWSENEPFHAHVKVANFTGEDLDGEAEYDIDMPMADLLKDLKAPARVDLQLTARTDRRQGHNSWPIWVYPADNRPDRSGVVITRKLDRAALQALNAGKKVLLMPSGTTGTVGGLFQTDYWNYRMFRDISLSNGKPVSPGTLGILTDPSHPVFREFPTEEHTNWQWFPVLKASRPMILDALAGYRPIVQVIDNVERNHRLGLLFEFAVGKGKLLVCCADLESVLEYPEGRQFYKAVLDYMRSDDFRPSVSLDTEQLTGLFR